MLFASWMVIRRLVNNMFSLQQTLTWRANYDTLTRLYNRGAFFEIARKLSQECAARYYKDGAEILIDRGWDKSLGEADFDNADNQVNRPRRLTPRECARLMGFEAVQGNAFRIPVSDTQAYRQFGNSVVVPAFAAVAKLLESTIKLAVKNRTYNK